MNPGPALTPRRKIAYLCDLSPQDHLAYSGGNTRICKALQDHVGDVTVLDPGWGKLDPLRRAITGLPEPVTIRTLWRTQLAIARLIAPAIQKQLVRGRFDVLFGAYAFHMLAGLRLPNGMFSVYTSDATPTTQRRSGFGRPFGSRLRMLRWLDPMLLRAEKRVFRKMDLLLWPTEWLKSGADDLYGLGADRSMVVPWGANVPDPSPSDLPPALSRNTPIRFVLVGRDWGAKGGPLVFDTIRQLHARGIMARLDVIGVHPPDEYIADYVTAHGMPDRSEPEQVAKYEALLRQAHFLFQPSFENYGFMFCEASAYGLPSLCLRIGGIPVRDGVNGHALTLGAGPADFANRVEHYLSKPQAYLALRKRARREYEERLNWDAWGERVDAILTARRR